MLCSLRSWGPSTRFNMVPSKFMSTWKTQNVNSIEHRVLAGILNRIKKRSYWIGMGPESNDCVLIKRGEKIQTHREKIMRTQRQRLMYLQAKGCQGLLEPPEAGRGVREGFSLRAFRRSMALPAS